MPRSVAPRAGGLPPQVVAAVDAQSRTENFPVALRLLPRAARNDLLALYRYARLVDDLGDEAPGDRAALLDVLAADVATLYDGGTPRIPIVARLRDTVVAHDLPREPFDALIEANRRDQSVTRCPSYDDLLDYCRLSANPVGHLVLGVFDADTADRRALSDRICTALQIVEHVQDVGEDARRGRIYLPQDDMAEHGVRESDLLAPTASEGLRRLLAFEAARADVLLQDGAPLVRTLTGAARLAVAGYVAGGRAAIAALQRADHDVLAVPVRPSRRRTARELATAWRGR